MKIRPVGAELFHADRRTNGRTGRQDEAKSRFSQFCEKRLKMIFLYNICQALVPIKPWHSDSSYINWNETYTNSFTFSANLTQIIMSNSLC